MQPVTADSRGWGKIKKAAAYAGVSERTLRPWLKCGLRHSRLPSGTVLVSFAAIDDFLAHLEVIQNQVDDIVDEVVEEIQRNT